MTTRAGSAPSSSKMRSWARPTSDRTAWVVIASPVARDARAAARWTRSSDGETHGLSVPISPMIPGRTPDVPHSFGRLADQLVGQVVGRAAVDAGLGRVVGRAIPAAAHDDVEVTGRRESGQPRRVPPDAGERQVDQPAPAGLPEARELGEDHRLVAGQLPVIPAALDVPQGDLGVLVRQRETERIRLDGTEDRLDVGHGGRCYAVATASGAPAVIDRAPSSSSTIAIARRSRSAGR